MSVAKDTSIDQEEYVQEEIESVDPSVVTEDMRGVRTSFITSTSPTFSNPAWKRDRVTTNKLKCLLTQGRWNWLGTCNISPSGTVTSCT